MAEDNVTYFRDCRTFRRVGSPLKTCPPPASSVPGVTSDAAPGTCILLCNPHRTLGITPPTPSTHPQTSHVLSCFLSSLCKIPGSQFWESGCQAEQLCRKGKHHGRGPISALCGSHMNGGGVSRQPSLPAADVGACFHAHFTDVKAEASFCSDAKSSRIMMYYPANL